MLICFLKIDAYYFWRYWELATIFEFWWLTFTFTAMEIKIIFYPIWIWRWIEKVVIDHVLYRVFFCYLQRKFKLFIMLMLNIFTHVALFSDQNMPSKVFTKEALIRNFKVSSVLIYGFLTIRISINYKGFHYAYISWILNSIN